jgi:hypothetical protein
MLDTALKYQTAIDKFIADSTNDVGEYELRNTEWEVLAQLRNVLKVRYCVLLVC